MAGRLHQVAVSDGSPWPGTQVLVHTSGGSVEAGRGMGDMMLMSQTIIADDHLQTADATPRKITKIENY